MKTPKDPLDRITPDMVEKFKTARARKKSEFTGRKLRPATINRELACLKILFNRFEDTVPKNPVRKVKFLAEDNEQLRVLTAEEVKAISSRGVATVARRSDHDARNRDAARGSLPHSPPERSS